ncbi:hypothetical protein P3X46_028223, partial [Hevea brasiliensis]
EKNVKKYPKCMNLHCLRNCLTCCLGLSKICKGYSLGYSLGLSKICRGFSKFRL